MDDRRELLCVFIVFNLIGCSLPVPAPKSPECEKTRVEHLHEGNIGQVEHFPWLGVLRVHLHEPTGELKIAVTGLVLVKSFYAIANADDVSKIPKDLFMSDSKAMFIPKRDEPWFTKPKDYLIHPEYEFSTYSTIALIELELEPRTQVPFKPVCWPGQFFNASNQLYALGYTDENKLLEKTLHSLQYVKPSLCDEFYNRVGFSEPKTAPTYVRCGFAANNKEDCTWENGMAMASNATGVWTLIGFGLRGPGCSAPARFIDMSEYFPWIESATDLEEMGDFDYSQKSAFAVGFRRSGKKDTKAKATPESADSSFFREQYPGVDPGRPRDFKVYELDPDANVFWIYPMNATEAPIEPANGQSEVHMKAAKCVEPKVLLYSERMRLVDDYQNKGTLSYRISEVLSQSPVKFWFTTTVDRYEGSSFLHDAAGDTPHHLMKLNPLPPPYPKIEEVNPDIWTPGKQLEAKHIIDEREHRGFVTFNLVLGFSFWAQALMELAIYGYPVSPPPPPTSNSSDSATKKPKKKKSHLRGHSSFGNKRWATATKKTNGTNTNRRKEYANRPVPAELRRKMRQRLQKANKRVAERKAKLKMMAAYGLF